MTSHLPSGKAGAAQLTRGQLRAALQAALTDAEAAQPACRRRGVLRERL